VRRREVHVKRAGPPEKKGPAVGEVVGRRPYWRRTDHAVARHGTEILPADSPAQLHHATDRRAGRDHVVDCGMALSAELCLERRQLHRYELVLEGTFEPALELLLRNTCEETDASEVDAENRDAGAEKALQRPEHRPVAAEDDGEVDVVRSDELDTGLLRHPLAALDRRRDELGLAVRNHGGAPNRRHPGSNRRARPAARPATGARGGERTHGCPWGRGAPSQPPRRSPRPSRARPRPPRAAPARGQPDLGPLRP